VNEDYTEPTASNPHTGSNIGSTSTVGKSLRPRKSVGEGVLRLTQLATIFTGDAHLDSMINSIAVDKLKGGYNALGV
jgi:hypothetical protein